MCSKVLHKQLYLVLGFVVGVPEGEVHGRGEEDPVDALPEDEKEFYISKDSKLCLLSLFCPKVNSLFLEEKQ